MSWWTKLRKKLVGGDSGDGGACHHGEIHLRQGTAAFEAFVAQGELESGGNLKHGAGHLASLLSYDPTHPQSLALLDGYLTAAGPDPEALIPRGDKAYYSTEALRAYIWHRQGRLEDAVDLLAQVAVAKPEVRYPEAWVQGWLEPAGAVESLTESTGLRLFSAVLQRLPEARLALVPRLRESQRWAELMERFVQRYPGEAPTQMMRAGLLRKAGLFDQAEVAVRPALDRSPSWHLATALGLILRQKGDLDEAEEAFRRALELDPNDVSARLEAGDMFWEHDEWQRALAWYQNALAQDARHDWAYPSALHCRWMITQDERHTSELSELANQGNDRARYLWYRVLLAELPEPRDATANGLRQLRDSILKDRSRAPTGEAKLSLSCLEAPSNFLAFRLEMEALKQDLWLAVQVEAIPRPDPREAVEAVRYPLWRYDGTDASPALPPPPDDIVRRIAALAAESYDEDANWASASRVAEELGTECAPQVLAVMVHPPPVPEGRSALAWLPRVQLAAAYVVAHLDSGWEGSVRREALLSVLFGPQDWATKAAIRALARMGAEYEPIAPVIGEAFAKLEALRPVGGECCWEDILYSEWLRLPHLFDNERKELREKLESLDAQDAGHA